MHHEQYPPRFGEELERESHGPTEPRESGLAVGFWFVLIFVRPRRFFELFVQRNHVAITCACAYTFGVSRTIDRVNDRLVMGQGVSFITSWESYWAFTLVVGLIAALVWFYIGG